MSVKLSIALCTYNGEQYLPELLESLLSQTRQPDELVICDDQSSDATQDIIEAFKKRCHFLIKWHRNESRLNSTLNFANAISLCNGQYIALCDQDDVWLPTKLEALTNALDNNPQAGFVISDALVVGQQLQPFGYTLWESLNFTSSEQQQFLIGNAFAKLLKRYRATGATMVFRASYRNLILPIPPSWVHDAWIAQLLSAVSNVELITEPQILYRQHSSQQIGQVKRNLYQQYRIAKTIGKEQFQTLAQNFQLALDRLSSITDYEIQPQDLKRLETKISHAQKRTDMRDSSFRLPLIMHELAAGNYSRYSLGWKSVLQDLFL